MTLPPQPFGFVAGRWVLSIGDTPDDPDRAPDYIPVPKGRVTFTPALSHRVVPDPTTHPDGWTGIIKRPVVATLGPQGQLIDGEGHDFIALPLGTYSVSYDFEGTPWPSHYLEVTAESTVEAPLWLPTMSPLPTGPGVVQVVTEATRIAAEAAAARAEVAADSAWLAVEAPGRQGPQGEQGPQGPPGEVTTAALTTALAGKVSGTGMTVRVDTSVGTRVLLDHPNGTTILSYDSGWRALCRWTGGAVTEGTLPTGLTPRGTGAGGIYIRRLLDTITVAIVDADVTQPSPVINLPHGFQGTTTPYPAVPIFYRDTTLQPRLANAEFGSGFVRFRDVPAGATLSAAGTGGYGVMATAPAINLLPTAMPGTPA